MKTIMLTEEQLKEAIDAGIFASEINTALKNRIEQDGQVDKEDVDYALENLPDPILDAIMDQAQRVGLVFEGARL